MSDTLGTGGAGEGGVSRRSLILIVDDEPFNVDYLEQELELLGYDTMSASNGREALEMVRENAPDLILLDVIMPEIDGFTVCRMLKDDRKTRLIPIVIMTSLDATEDRVKGIEAGADDFLTKPVNEEELIARIRTALRFKHAVDDEMNELRTVSDHLAKFVPDAVNRIIASNPSAPELQKREKDVSILFVDISGYTRISEKITPVVLNMLVERYFSTFLDRIHDSDGDVSETSGDGMMAIFQDGDPDRHAVKATDTALALLEANERLNAENSIQPLGIHMGVNSGSALVGPTRYRGRRGVRWVFTADGPVINIASRLADVAKEGELVAGAETVRRLAGRYPLELAGRKSLKNVAEPVEIFRVLGPPSATQTPRREAPTSGPPPTDRAAQSLAASPVEGAAPVTEAVPDTRSESTADDAASGAGLPWPSDYRDMKPAIYETWGVEDELYLNRTLSGKSGALVYAVDVTGRSFSGQAILKLDKVPDPRWRQAEETELHRRAVVANPEFAARHLPTIIETCRHDDRIAALLTIAGRGLEYAHPWAECPYDRQLSAAKQLSRGLLEDWNADYRLATGVLRPRDMVRRWLGYRLEPSQGGRIHGFFAEHCAIAADAPTFTFEGSWYPNPLAFAEGAQALPDRLQLRAITGNVHGDLHGNNVLVSYAKTADLDYYLIDLAHYLGGQFLFYDHAYFELHYVLIARLDAAFSRWKAILEAIGKPDPGAAATAASGDDLGLTGIAKALREEEFEWIERHEPNRLSYMESQHLLARVAVGLNFTHKALPPHARCLALIYAADNLKRFFTLHSVDWPKDGQPLNFAD